MAAGHIVIFDGDDTLWRTQELYDEIKARFASLVQAEGISHPQPIAVLDRIDSEAAETQGFTVRRFADSMLRTYQLLSQGEHRRTLEKTERQIQHLVEPLLGPYVLYPDALEVLGQLSSRFPLVLATKGEPDLQDRKIRQLGLERFFRRVYLLERKSERELERILTDQQAPAERSWSVGNSVRSDINPALHLGMRAIWIKRPTWRFEEATLEPGTVTTVSTLLEAAWVILADERKAAALISSDRD